MSENICIGTNRIQNNRHNIKLLEGEGSEIWKTLIFLILKIILKSYESAAFTSEFAGHCLQCVQRKHNFISTFCFPFILVKNANLHTSNISYIYKMYNFVKSSQNCTFS